MRIRKTTELLETVNEADFPSSLVHICVLLLLSLSSSGSSLACRTSLRPYLERCALKVSSSPFNSTQMDSETIRVHLWDHLKADQK